MPFAYVDALTRRWRRSSGAIAWLSLLLTGCGLDHDARDVPPSALLFISEESGNPDIHYVRLPGRPRKWLSSGEHEYPAAVSRDGQVAVVSVRDSGDRHAEQIFLVRHGGKPRPVFAQYARFARNPSFSPSGNDLFLEAGSDSARNIVHVNLQTFESRRLTSSRHGSFEPAASPRGDAVAFVASVDDGNTEIFTMSPDGSAVRRITAFHREDLSPRWAAHGRMLAFISNREGVDRVFLANPDGTGQRRLGPSSPDIESETDVVWSPKREQLVFSRRVAGRWRLVLYDLVGNRERYLTAATEHARFPAFSPDGDWVAFTTISKDDTDVVVMRVNGTDRRIVAGGPKAEWLPLWLP